MEDTPLGQPAINITSTRPVTSIDEETEFLYDCSKKIENSICSENSSDDESEDEEQSDHEENKPMPMPGMTAFTLNPNPKKYNTDDPLEQYAIVIQNVLSHQSLKDSCKSYYIYPELTENGNVHIHGYLFVKDRIKFYRSFLPLCKRMGHTKIKTKNIDSKWVEYCQKDQDLMTEMMEPQLPVPYTVESFEHFRSIRKAKLGKKLAKTHSQKAKQLLAEVNKPKYSIDWLNKK